MRKREKEKGDRCTDRSSQSFSLLWKRALSHEKRLLYWNTMNERIAVSEPGALRRKALEQARAPYMTLCNLLCLSPNKPWKEVLGCSFTWTCMGLKIPLTCKYIYSDGQSFIHPFSQPERSCSPFVLTHRSPETCATCLPTLCKQPSLCPNQTL